MKTTHRFKPHRTQLISRTRSGSELAALRNLPSDEEIADCLRHDPTFQLSRRVAHAAQRMAAAREINRRFGYEGIGIDDRFEWSNFTREVLVPDEFYSPQQVRKEAA